MSRSDYPGCGALRSFPRVSGDEPVSRIEIEQTKSFPRVSGDEPRWMSTAVSSAAFSPRERG